MLKFNQDDQESPNALDAELHESKVRSDWNHYLDGEEDAEPDDDEDEEYDEDEEDEEELLGLKPARKPAAKAPEASDVMTMLADIKRDLNKGGSSTSTEKKISKVDAMLGGLLQSGADKGDIATMMSLLGALKEDILSEAQESKAVDLKQTLDDRCYEAMESEVDKWIAKHPVLSWSRVEIMEKAHQLMATGKKYAPARAAYSQGRKPSQEFFKESVSRVVEIFAKQSGIKSSGKSELDIKSSKIRSTPSSVPQAKPSENPKSNKQIDVSKLSPFEREIYITTLNETKNEEIALSALQDIRAARRSR